MRPTLCCWLEETISTACEGGRRAEWSKPDTVFPRPSLHERQEFCFWSAESPSADRGLPFALCAQPHQTLGLLRSITALANSTDTGAAPATRLETQTLHKKIVVHQLKSLALKIRTRSHAHTSLTIGPAVEERKISELYV